MIENKSGALFINVEEKLIHYDKHLCFLMQFYIFHEFIYAARHLP